MASTTTVPNFMLTPQQQSLLFAALSTGGTLGATGPNGVAPGSLEASPAQNNTSIFQTTPFVDNFDYEYGPESSFDLDFSGVDGSKMIDDLPGDSQSPTGSNHDGDNSDKRSHPDEDEDAEEANPKRRESDKVPKKPGRKPITTEPTSKRKQQNRQAQRAFRERKEKHLKDLETKVEELTKDSEAANNENASLKAQIEKITAELNQYKSQVTLLTSSRSTSRDLRSFGQPILGNLNDVNFHFEFPKFGQLPGPGVFGAPAPQRQSSSARSPSNGMPSPRDTATPGSVTNGATPPMSKLSTDFSSLPSGFFNPPLTGSVVADASRNSLDSSRHSNNGAGPTASSSPSASSHSNHGPSSSCGTSPEPSAQSPLGFKHVDTMTTIGEEQPAMSIFGTASTTAGATGFGQLDAAGTPAFDLNNFDWLAQQNGGQFDPQFFADYREPHDNILAGSTFDDSFFNDAFDMDFTTPYNVPTSLPTPKSSAGPPAKPQAQKVDLIAQIDAAKDGDEVSEQKLMTCTKIWDQLQNCPKVQSGDFDLDGLCKDLQMKAKCSGKGPVVDEKTFDHVVKKYLGEAGCDSKAL